MPPPPPSSPEADEEKWLVGTEVAAEGRKDGRNEGRQAGMKEEGGSSERERERGRVERKSGVETGEDR